MRRIDASLLIVLAAFGCAVAPQQTTSKDEVLREIWRRREVTPEGWDAPYVGRSVRRPTRNAPSDWLRLYETVDFRSTELYRRRMSGYGPAARHCSVDIKSFSSLDLRDTDGDGRTESFSLYSGPGEPMTDINFFFDINEDGRTDYLVLDVGMSTMVSSGEATGFMWINHHMLDRNQDGRVDTQVFNDVDLSGDERPDDGLSAWLYDDDFDGRVDGGEYRGYTARFPVAGRFTEPLANSPFAQSMLETPDTIVLRRAGTDAKRREWPVGEPVPDWAWSSELLASIDRCLAESNRR